eukprot:TRINITY_DN3226_c0_g1_i5.p1 TRINITY_DN3226_c0_g1~~TRINITY_DN3226_c0_g1_i5.p1  ORF type:complete len:222 (+),score=30.82 TRINITY_DN3226_c0_g1_i5:257-922(+)
MKAILFALIGLILVYNVESFSECGNTGESYSRYYGPSLYNETSGYTTQGLPFPKFLFDDPTVCTVPNYNYTYPNFNSPSFVKGDALNLDYSCIVMNPQSIQQLFETPFSVGNLVCKCSTFTPPPAGKYVVGVKFTQNARYSSAFTSYTFDLSPSCSLETILSSTAPQVGDVFHQYVVLDASNPLSKGAIAAIVVSSIVGVIIAATLVYCLKKRKRVHYTVM